VSGSLPDQQHPRGPPDGLPMPAMAMWRSKPLNRGFRLQPASLRKKRAYWCQKAPVLSLVALSRVLTSSHKTIIGEKLLKGATQLFVAGVRHLRSARIMGLRKNKLWLGNSFVVLLYLGLATGGYPQNAPSPASSELPDSPGALFDKNIPETATASVISSEPNRRFAKYSLVVSPDEITATGQPFRSRRMRS
jgi:hypothetical protein